MKNVPVQLVMLIALLSGCSGKENNGTASDRSAPPIQSGGVVTSSRLNLEVSNNSSTPPPDMATLSLGESVYKSTCSICHQSGLKGAPRIGSKADWQPRLDQGKELLYQRAINGYRGSKGSMPSRGSNAKLTETEVKAAVDYMCEHAIPGWTIER